MKVHYFIFVTLLLINCASQKSTADVAPSLSCLNGDAVESDATCQTKPKETSSKLENTSKCWDGNMPDQQGLCPPPPTLQVIACPDGRVLGPPFDCRNNDEIRVDNGKLTCAEHDMKFDVESNSCIP